MQVLIKDQLFSNRKIVGFFLVLDVYCFNKMSVFDFKRVGKTLWTEEDGQLLYTEQTIGFLKRNSLAFKTFENESTT